MGSSVAAVVLVFAFLGAVLVLVRRWTGGGAAGLSLQVVDAVNLGGGRTVTVIRSGERFFLLGTTIHAVSMIAELDASDVAGNRQAAEIPEPLTRLPVLSAFLKSLRDAR